VGGVQKLLRLAEVPLPGPALQAGPVFLLVRVVLRARVVAVKGHFGDPRRPVGYGEVVLVEILEGPSGVTIWSKSRFVVDFRNLLFGRDFDLSFSKGYGLMKFFNL
jgi:hypothetical protein